MSEIECKECGEYTEHIVSLKNIMTHAEAEDFKNRAEAGQYGDKSQLVIDAIQDAYREGRVR